MKIFHSPTVQLLNASTVVAITGSFRMYIAILLSGIDIKPWVVAAYGLIVYSTYTLDRALGCEEDAINRRELFGAKKNIGIGASIVAFLLGAVLLAGEHIYLASLLPFITGYVYSKGFSVGECTVKLKGSMGGKNIVIGLTWGGSIALIISRYTSNVVTIGSLFFFFGIKMFINSTLYDFKDVNGDLASGIRTLPICLGEVRTKCLLLALCIFLYAFIIISLQAGYVCAEWALLITSFVFTASFICLYSIGFEERVHGIKKKFRLLMVIGEWPTALLSRLVGNVII